jgi:hypothetical protein
MSRLQQPLDHQILWSTGDLLLRAELDLLLKDNQGNWHARIFRVDSASDMTTMPAHDARQLGLAMPAHDARQLGLAIPVNAAPLKHEQTGLEVRSGYLRCQVVGMDQSEYAFPCFFLGDPGLPPDPKSPPAVLPRCLLGLSGVIDKLRIAFDGDPAPGAPHGCLIVEKK